MKFYNEEIIPDPHVFSIQGYLLNVNGAQNLNESELLIDFNLRNISISFFANVTQWIDFHSDSSENVTHFVELEDCEVEAIPFKFQDPDHLELTLKPSRWQVLDENDHPVEDFPRITSVLLVVSNKNDMFMSKIFSYFKSKTPMQNDNNMTDQESVVSFQTLRTSIGGDFAFLPKANLTYNLIPTPVEEEIIPKSSSDDPSDVYTGNFDSLRKIPETLMGGAQEDVLPENMHALDRVNLPQESLSQSNVMLSARSTQMSSQDLFKKKSESELQTAKQTAKIDPNFKNISNPLSGKTHPAFKGYDVIPSDDQLPPVHQFMSHRRNIRRNQKTTAEHRSQEAFLENIISTQPSQNNLGILSTREISKKSPAVKGNTKVKKIPASKLTPRQAANQIFDYSTEEDLPAEPIRGKFKRKTMKRVSVNGSDEDAPLKKTRKRSTPAAKPNPLPVVKSTVQNPLVKTKVTQEAKLKTAQAVPREKFEVIPPVGPKPHPMPTEKTVSKPRLTFKFSNKSTETSKEVFDKLKAAESIKVTKLLGKLKPAAVPSPPTTNVMNTKRPPLDNPDQPPAKKSRVDFDKLPNKVGTFNFKQQQRVGFKGPVQTLIPEEISQNEEVLTFTQQDAELKKQKHSEPQPLKQKKTTAPETGKQQRKAQLNQTEINEKENRLPQSTKPKVVKKLKPTFQPESRQLPKRRRPSHQLNNENVPLQKKAKDQKTPVSNFGAVEKNTILDMFLKDTISYQEQVSYEDELDENFHIKTQTVHKKMSPTMIRSVQIKEINLVVPDPTVVKSKKTNLNSEAQPTQSVVALFNKKAEQNLSKTLLNESRKALEPLIEKMQEIKGREITGFSEAKEKLKASIAKSRESKTFFKNQVQDHIKLLKRLDHSKRRVMQLYDEDRGNTANLKMALNQVIRGTRLACKEKAQEIEKISDSIFSVEKDIKSVVWKKHLETMQHKMQQVLDQHINLETQ